MTTKQPALCASCGEPTSPEECVICSSCALQTDHRIAALEADVERWQSKAGAEHDRVKELEDALDAKSYLAAQNDEYYAQITALETEIEQLMKTEEARAVAYGHWKQKEIDRLEAENAELRKPRPEPGNFSYRETYMGLDLWASTREQHNRIAENERLRVAFESHEESRKLRFPRAQAADELADDLRAALKGEGDE